MVLHQLEPCDFCESWCCINLVQQLEPCDLCESWCCIKLGREIRLNQLGASTSGLRINLVHQLAFHNLSETIWCINFWSSNQLSESTWCINFRLLNQLGASTWRVHLMRQLVSLTARQRQVPTIAGCLRHDLIVFKSTQF